MKTNVTVVPVFARNFLANCPAAGQGVHNWLFRVASLLNPLYPAKADLFQLIKAACATCGRVVSDSEIQDAIDNSTVKRGDLERKATVGWPKPNSEQIEAIARDGVGLEQLRAKSPVQFKSNEDSRAEEVIDILFPGNPLLCVGSTKSLFDTRPREQWRGRLANKQLIVPSPMSAICGKVKSSGKLSKHTLENTGPRRFLVVEFDPLRWGSLSDEQRIAFQSESHYIEIKLDEQAALLHHLGRFAPLTMVVHSAGKSLHGWVYCHGQREERLLKFMRYGRFLGADRATWLKSQFVRLPEGLRDNGNRQSVIFLNPKTLL